VQQGQAAPFNDLRAQEEGAPPPQCCLCPVSGGALKPAEGDGLWCHVTCMQWVPEVTVGDTGTMEPVLHVRSIVRDRWELMCCFCKCAPPPAGPARRARAGQPRPPCSAACTPHRNCARRCAHSVAMRSVESLHGTRTLARAESAAAAGTDQLPS
jgi:hypothetical protein